LFQIWFWWRLFALGRIPAEAFGSIPHFIVKDVDAAAIAEYSRANALEHLQAGELAALAVCNQTETDIVLTDDLAVRRAATALKRIPVGSIGYHCP
jgi:predicted nucleic acid-binding protein